MDFLNSGIPIGRYFGISVRLHFTFLIYAFYRLQDYDNKLLGLAFVVGVYVCILLHEFGHALAARWCDGEANEILLWPLGGLAFVRPAWSPTAHLITTVAGPFVTLVLWLVFVSAAMVMRGYVDFANENLIYVYLYVSSLAALNFWLLMFNLIPAFPMDGGRILRDTLWHFMSAEKATHIAIIVSRMIAVAGAAWAIAAGQYWIILLALFVFTQCSHEQQVVAYEAGGAYQFSLRERLRRGRRQRTFQRGVRDLQRAEESPFHRCAVCGVTEREAPRMEFRVCTECADGREYCDRHIDSHHHV